MRASRADNSRWQLCGVEPSLTNDARIVARAAGHFVSEGERLEGDFRSGHVRLKSNAEAVAFAGGVEAEKAILNTKMDALIKQVHRRNNARGLWRPIESFVLYRMPDFVTQFLRMIWAQGYGDQTTIMNNQGGTDISSTGEYIEMLIQRAFGTFSTLLSLNEDFSTLFGIVGRVTDLMLVMDELNAKQQAVRTNAETRSPPNSPRASAAAAAGAISFCAVDIVTPDGQCIAQNVDFQVFSDGQSNLAITGGNAVGKSSLFRIMGGIWPQQRGRIQLPPRAHETKIGGVALVPQQPLVPTVAISLADMITYPLVVQPPAVSSKTSEDAVSEELRSLLELVGLKYLSDREGLWGTAKPWGDLLSLGEQQALGIARLLYARPQYAVLDECLSAVSSQVQAAVFAALADRNIATIAIMHEVNEVAAPYFMQELKLGEPVPSGWTLRQLQPEKADEGTTEEALEGGPDVAEDCASQDSSGSGVLVDAPSPIAG